MIEVTNIRTSVEVLSKDFARRRVMELQCSSGRSFFEIAGVISLIKQKKWFRDWGYSSFDLFVTTELKIKPRTAYSLSHVYEYFFVKNEFQAEVLDAVDRIGWAKAELLTRISAPDTIKELAGRALNMDFFGFAELVKTRSGIASNGLGVIRSSFVFDRDDFGIVEAAIEGVKGSGPHARGTALGVICREFLENLSRSTVPIEEGPRSNL